ncbi:MAG: PilT protein domain protein [Chthonomonadales bacterium]|nr:PilT protein domain protein [Chthonomonadales bacterium]
MAIQYIIDTHTLLWYVADDRALGKNAGTVLDDPTSELILPAIVFAEACFIVERGKVSLSLPTLIAAIDSDERITFVSLDRTIIERTITLTTVGEMHDRQIVATALTLQDAGENVVVLTKDSNITASGVVAVLW